MECLKLAELHPRMCSIVEPVFTDYHQGKFITTGWSKRRLFKKKCTVDRILLNTGLVVDNKL